MQRCGLLGCALVRGGGGREGDRGDAVRDVLGGGCDGLSGRGGFEPLVYWEGGESSETGRGVDERFQRVDVLDGIGGEVGAWEGLVFSDELFV